MNLLAQTVTIYRRSTRDKYGKLTFGTGTRSEARMRIKEKRRLLPNGEIVLIAGHVILPPDAAVDTDDKIAYGGADYRVYSVNQPRDGNGAVHHQTLELTKWQS